MKQNPNLINKGKDISCKVQACRLAQGSLCSNLVSFQLPGMIEVLSTKSLLALTCLTPELHIRGYHFHVVFF